MGQTGRADLLRALRHGGAEVLTLAQTDSHWIGYRTRPAVVEPEATPFVGIDVDLEASAAPKADPPRDALRPIRLPLKMPCTWVVDSSSSRDLAQELRDVPALRAVDLEARADDPLPYRDLVPWARATPALKRASARWLDAGIDWPRLAGLLACKTLPRRLPMRHIARWPTRLVLALDFSPRLEPYYFDLHRLAVHLDAQLDRSSLSVRTFEHGPPDRCRPWRHPRRASTAASASAGSTTRDWPRLPPGTVVLVASDLGLFDSQPDTHAAWLQWGRDLRAQGCRVAALAPVGADQLTTECLRVFELLRWSPDSHWRRETAAAAPETPSATAAASSSAASAMSAPVATDASAEDGPLETLLAFAATALRIDPPLLRAWRGLLPTGSDAGLEGRFWNHVRVDRATLTCALKGEHVDQGLDRHARLPPALRSAARSVRVQQHEHLRSSMNSAEDLRWAVAQPLDDASDRRRQQAQLFVKSLLRGLDDGVTDLSDADRRALQGTAALVQSAAAARVRAQDPALFAALDACVERLRGGAAAASATATVGASTRWVLAQQCEALRLLPADDDTPVQRLAPPAELPADRPAVVWVESRGESSWLPLLPQAPVLARLGQGAEIVRTSVGAQQWVVREEHRPYWAEAWAWEDGTAIAQAQAPDGGELRFAQPFASQRATSADGRFTATVDGFGLVGELALSDTRVPPLRVRLMPAGSFMMGSPDGVGDADERPQHPVTLSRPFWLAEAPCTQALWAAVMGHNPSHFKHGDDASQRPVESVSWDDVQHFLEALGPLLPRGCQALLPSEAQWEYAARAGSDTAYSWGDLAAEGQANWSMEQGGTTPVGRYPANPWGLFDMHGNVWECCADGKRAYGSNAEFDPRGPEGKGLAARVVRGGSWIDRPGFARSAYRNGGHPGIRARSLGFRLALRSSSPEAGGQVQRPGGPVVEAGRRDGAPGLLDRLRTAVGYPKKRTNGRP